MNFQLLILDADGTLVDRDSGELLPGVEEFLDLLRRARNRPAVAIATNQGGVGLRLMMERDGWGEPAKYPTEQQALAQYERLAQKLKARLYLSFAYQLKSGEWSTMPDDAPRPEYWLPDWRKPAAGMLLQAMRDAGATPTSTLMIGDRPEDQEAAAAAGCSFQSAQKYFGR